MVELQRINKIKISNSQIHYPLLNLNQVVHCLSSGTKEEDCFHIGPVTLHVDPGEIVAILGPSGSGKTTLLRIIAGLDISRSGDVTINGREVFSSKTFVPPEKRKVGMVFQDHTLFPHLNVRNNILFGIQHRPSEEKMVRLKELADLLGLHHYLDRYPHELSGGQQQRVALARTLAPKPELVLLDEPLSNIDAGLRSSLAQELRNVIKRTGTTALWVTHDQVEALDIADRIIVINEGKIEQMDTPWNLYNHPKTRFVADFVGHAVFIPGELEGNRVVTELGPIECLPCLKTAKKQEVMIRPDDVDAVPDEKGKAVVCKRQFFGSVQLYSLQLPSGRIILTNQPPHINWPPDTKVSIRLRNKTMVSFPVAYRQN